MFKETAQSLIKFIDKSPTCFHAVKNIQEELLESGYTRFAENQKWEIKPGTRGFVTRNDSSIIAFAIPECGSLKSFRIVAAHSDSPTFKIKENPEMPVSGHYVRLNTERYGGMIYSSWMDRPLSIAGRVIVKEGCRYVSKLVDVDRDLVMIPNLAIHMNRQINEGYVYNPQKDLLPLYGGIDACGSFNGLIAKAAGISEDSEDAILGHDLFLYNRQKGTIWGANEEFVSSARLDDLQCAYGMLQGFLKAPKACHGSIYCVFDNEEVGSGTKQGAASTFLFDVLTRICECLGMTGEDYRIALADSFMLSGDNAHAVHPAYEEKADPTNRPYINEGIVIKYNASQKYCTDGISAAMFKDICREADVPFQTFTNRSDVAGGETLGNISNTQVALNSVDIGLPQLAMHSPYETAGVKDTEYLIRATEKFFK